MPLYEYVCKKCNKPFEIMQKMSESGNAKCPGCGGRGEKQISASGFQLKGSGWYKDGYSSKPATATETKKTDSKA